MIINYIFYDNSFSARNQRNALSFEEKENTRKWKGDHIHTHIRYRYDVYMFVCFFFFGSRCEIYYFSRHKMTLPIWILALLIAIYVFDISKQNKGSIQLKWWINNMHGMLENARGSSLITFRVSIFNFESVLLSSVFRELIVKHCLP